MLTTVAPPVVEKKQASKQPFFQAKLTVNEPGDVYEQEADAVADRVMRMPAHAVSDVSHPFNKVPISSLQRKCTKCEEEEKVQRKESASGGQTAPPVVSDVISSSGQPLNTDTRHFMETRMGQDFGDVQIHTDSRAAASAQSINALAYTSGKHIVFNSGQYQPNTDSGKRLLAHELVHVGQQGGDNVKRIAAQAPKASVCDQPQSETIKEAKGPEAETVIPNNGGRKANTQETTSTTEKPSAINADASSLQAPEATAEPRKEATVAHPSQDEAFKRLAGDTKKAKTSQNQHDKSENIAQEAEQSANNPTAKGTQIGEANKVLATEKQLATAPVFSKEVFKANIKKLVQEGLPKNEQDEQQFKEKGGIQTLTSHVGGQVASPPDPSLDAVRNTQNASTTAVADSPLFEKQVTPTQPENPGRKAKIGQSERAVPKPVPQEAVQLDEAHNADSLDKAMEDERLAEFNTKLINEQLATSDEPEFQETLTTKQEAQTQLCQIPAQNREAEYAAHQQEADQAQGALNKAMRGKFDTRQDSFGQINEGKDKTRQKDEAILEAYYQKIAGIYATSKTQVDDKLKALEAIPEIFSTAMTEANDTFKSNVKSRLNDYYGVGVFNLSEEDEDALERAAKGGLAGQIFWLKQKRTLTTDPAQIQFIDHKIRELEGKSDAIETIPERIFREEKTTFVNTLDKALDDIGTLIETTLNDARGIIQQGKEDIQCASQCVPANLQKEAQERTTDFMAKFDDMNAALVEKQKEIEESLAREYVKNVAALKETFEKIRAEAAMPWWKKAWNAIKKVATIIYDLGKLLVKVLVKAVSVIGDIIAHPLRFIENLFSAVKRGFSNFVDNIGSHLEKIILRLVLGVLPPGIQLPDSFDAKSIFSLALDILGFSKANIREKAVVKFGEPVVHALEETFDLFILFKNEGFAGLWAHIKERIGDLKEQVIEQVKTYLSESIVKAAIKFLLSALTPVSGFIKACETIINMAVFFIENLQNILQLLDSILDSFIDVAQGKLEKASLRVEAALQDILLIGIKFLAALVGIKFDAISAKINKLFNAVRAPIDRAINWLLEKAKAFAEKTGLIGLAKKGKAAVEKGKESIKQGAEKAVGHLMKWLGLKKEFVADNGETHKLYFSGNTEENARLFMASNNPGPYQTWVKNIKVEKSKQAKKDKAIIVAEEIDTIKKKKTKTPQEEEDKATELRSQMDKLSKLTGPLFTGIPECSTEDNGGLIFGKLKNGYGHSMKAEQLTKKKVPDGSVPNVSGNSSFNIINQRRKGAGSYYVLGHLLNHNLGGTGREWKNLTPLTRIANKEHEYIAEARVKTAVKAGNIVFYQVTAEYGRSTLKSKDKVINQIMEEEAKVPLSLSCTANMINPDTGEETPLVPKNTVISNDIDQDESDYDLVGIKRDPVYLSSRNAAKIATIDGVDKRLADKIVAAHLHKKSAFSSYEALAEYEFDGVVFTEKQKATINTLYDLQYVKLYDRPN